MVMDGGHGYFVVATMGMEVMLCRLAPIARFISCRDTLTHCSSIVFTLSCEHQCRRTKD